MMSPGAAPAPWHALDLPFGFELRCAFPALDDTIEIELARHGDVLLRKRLSADEPRGDVEFEWGLLRGEVAIEVDAFEGELAWEARIAARAPGSDAWKEWHERRVLMRFEPAVGRIGTSAKVYEPVVDDPEFGDSQLCTPAVLRIFVDEEERAIADVGRIVKARMFPRHPPFVFNTVACVGGVEDGAPGLYPNPNSIWFNVFFGCYQLDARKRHWSRPFGYRSAAGAAAEVEFEDLARIGKSDWNWFSNWMYGVPMEHVLPFSDIDMSEVETSQQSAAPIGSSLWHEVELRGIVAASTYESNAPGAARLVGNTIMSAVWRRAFGLPNPQPDRDQSFIPTSFDARAYMAYWEDEEAFHTVIFGGTSATRERPTFLDAQMHAVRALIEQNYPELGFPPA
jgi:hypothetical protein